MHGCCAGNKKDWESTDVTPESEKWHYSNLWFARRGYAVLNYTARGFVTTTLTGDKGSTGETQIDSRRFEINDFQSLAGQLADGLPAAMRIDPQRVLTIGGSYGGGFGWMALTDPRWRSPAGKAMKLAAVVTKYGWTDLAYSLVPTGKHMPGRLPRFDGGDSTDPLGMVKRSFTAALFESGAIGTPKDDGLRHATFPPEITQTLACLNANDPSQMPPPCSATIRSVVRSFIDDRSAYYQNGFFAKLASDPSLATPVYVGGTFSDQLFTSIETLRMVERLRGAQRGYPVQQYFGDYLHAAQAKPTEWADLCGADRHICTETDGARADTNAPPRNRTAVGVNSRVNAFVDHYVRPASNESAPTPPFDVTASLYVCKTNASETQPLELPGPRFTAPSFGALAPHALTASFGGSQTTTSTVGGDDHAAQADPVVNAASNKASCPNTTSPPSPGVAAYQTSALRSARTMIGLGRVTYRYSAQTADPSALQLNTRLYDVAPDGRATLVDRGVRRLGAASGTVTYALQGQGWRFERGHAIRLEVTQDDDPYVRRSTTPASLTITSARMRLPIREDDTAVGAGMVGRPVSGGASRRRCRGSALARIRVRPRGRGLGFVFPRERAKRVRITVFQQSAGRRILGNRTIARFRARKRSFTWRGRATRPGRRSRDGFWFVRLRRGRDERRLAFVRRGARFHRRPAFSSSPGCGLIPFYKLSSSVFGGRSGRALRIKFRLSGSGSARVRVLRGRARTVRSFRRRAVRRGRTVVLRLPSRGVRRGDVRVVLRARSKGRTVTRTLVARRL
jgi:hypothetical protein